MVDRSTDFWYDKVLKEVNFVCGMEIALFSFGGVFMAGYSYFNYDQMTIFEVAVHSDELELLKDAADFYDWEAIRAEVEHLFKEAAIDFRNRKRSSACPRNSEAEASLQETFPFPLIDNWMINNKLL